MWSQGLTDGQHHGLLVTSVALAIINKGRRRPRMRYFRLLAVLVAVQLLVGVALTAVAIFTATVSPSLRLRDLPYWAGIPLILSGFVGIVFVTRCYGDYVSNPVSNISKGISVTLTVVCIVLCACAVVFLSLHMVVFSRFDQCVDRYDTRQSPSPLQSPDDVSAFHDSDPQKRRGGGEGFDAAGRVTCTCWQEAGSGLRRLYVYENIACSDVLALIKFLFIVMSILGCGGSLSGAAYVFLLWIFRYKDVYVGVRVPDDLMDPPPLASAVN